MDAGRADFSPDSFARPAFLYLVISAAISLVEPPAKFAQVGTKKKPLLEGGGEAEQGLERAVDSLPTAPLLKSTRSAVH